MPIIRKLIKVGTSKAVIIPPSWIKCNEDKLGKQIDKLYMELDGIIKISVEDPTNGDRQT